MEFTDTDNVDILGDVLDLEDADDDDELVGADDEEIAGFFDDVLSAVSSVADVAKDIVKSPITKAVAGGLAIAFPPIGVPATAGLVAADTALRVAEGVKKGVTPKQSATMKRVLTNTVRAAKAGDKDAERAVGFMAAAKKVREKNAAKAQRPIYTGLFVDANGRISRGRWAKV